MTVAELESNNHLLLKCRSGSHAYGLATERSDEDFRGVFLLPYDRLLGLDYLPQVADDTNDRSYYELGRFLELLGKANPTALELLGTEGEARLYRHPALATLHMEDFLTKACRDTFAGYARSQIHKARGLNKKVHNPIPPERKGVTDFCYIIEDGRSRPLTDWAPKRSIPLDRLALARVNHARDLYAVYHDAGAGWAGGIVSSEKANQVSLSDVPKGAPLLAYLSFNKDGYSTYCRDYREYREWERNRNDARYRGTLAHGQGYDAKNMMHTIRLLEMATEIFTEGRLNVRRPNREFLLSIRAGTYSLDEVLHIAEVRLATLDRAAADSPLPDKLPADFVQQRVITLRKFLYERSEQSR
jgi:hypothetical protein